MLEFLQRELFTGDKENKLLVLMLVQFNYYRFRHSQELRNYIKTYFTESDPIEYGREINDLWNSFTIQKAKRMD